MSPSMTGSKTIRLAVISPQRPGSGAACRSRRQGVLGVEELLERDCGDGLPVCGHAELLGQVAAGAGGRGRCQGVLAGAALGDGAAEQPGCARHRQQGDDAHRAGGLAGDGDAGRVAAEARDVVLHPLQGSDLVEQAGVGDAVAEEQEPVGAEPVVDRDAHDAVAGEAGAVVLRDGAGAVGERAAVDPHQDRQAGVARVRCPDVQIEAVLAADGGLGQQRVERRLVGALGDGRPEPRAVPDAVP